MKVEEIPEAAANMTLKSNTISRDRGVTDGITKSVNKDGKDLFASGDLVVKKYLHISI